MRNFFVRVFLKSKLILPKGYETLDHVIARHLSKTGKAGIIPLDKTHGIWNGSAMFVAIPYNIRFPSNEIDAPYVFWFGRGDVERIRSFFLDLLGIGLKTHMGFGKIDHVEIRIIEKNASILLGDRPMRPIPLSVLGEQERNGKQQILTPSKTLLNKIEEAEIMKMVGLPLYT